jgi:GNAT superfamily N-acetyltransferase
VSDLLIRPLVPTDSMDELTALLHAAYAPLAAQGMHYLASHQDAATTEKRARGGICFIAAEAAAGRIVGTVTLYDPTPDSPCEYYRRGDVWHFAQFAVAPNRQGSGVGSRLLDVVEAEATAAGAQEIALDTSERASELIAYYERKGYKRVGFVTWGEVVNYRSVVLSKLLTDSTGL